MRHRYTQLAAVGVAALIVLCCVLFALVQT
jgi:hypothetical protein